MLSRSSTLPALPEPGGEIAASVVLQIENEAIMAIAHCVDVSTADEWRRRAAALERYLKSREMQGPMRGAQRRIEARIGQLLGRAEVGSNQHSALAHEIRLIPRPNDREDFRLLARALDGDCYLTLEEWRKSRRSLVKLVRERLGLETEDDEAATVGELTEGDADKGIVLLAERVDIPLFLPTPGIIASLKEALARASPKHRKAIREAALTLSELVK